MLKRISLNLNHKRIFILCAQLCISLVIVVLLSGCDLSMSPQSAAIEALNAVNDSNFKIDTQSVKILQTMTLNEKSVVLVLSFNGMRNISGLEKCIYSYQVEKQVFFWRMTNGGGGCWSMDSNETTDPLMVGGSQSGSSKPEDPGISQVFGIVNHPDIVMVRVTWNDGQVTNSEVSDSSYLSFRPGMAEMVKVEGLNDQDLVIYQFDPQIAPGKQ